jgi:hypothetical protein
LSGDNLCAVASADLSAVLSAVALAEVEASGEGGCFSGGARGFTSTATSQKTTQ